MDRETQEYHKLWGHYPFWDDPDPEGFNKRVKAKEIQEANIKEVLNGI